MFSCSVKSPFLIIKALISHPSLLPPIQTSIQSLLAAGHSPTLLQSLGIAPELILLCLPSESVPLKSPIQEIVSPHPMNDSPQPMNTFINARTQNYLIPLTDSEEETPKRVPTHWVKAKLMEKEKELLRLRQRLESRLKGNDSSHLLLDELEQKLKREKLTAVQGLKDKLQSQFKVARQKSIDNGLQIQLKRQEIIELKLKLTQSEKSLNRSLEIGQELSSMISTLEDHIQQQENQEKLLIQELDSLKEKMATVKQQVKNSDMEPSFLHLSTSRVFIHSEERIFRKEDFCLPSDICSQKKPQFDHYVKESHSNRHSTTFKPYESVVGLFKNGSVEPMQKLCANEILSVCKDPKCRWTHFKGSKFKRESYLFFYCDSNRTLAFNCQISRFCSRVKVKNAYFTRNH
jgi:hypothetical protein